MRLINCEINLILTWYENCVSSSANREKNTKLYVPIITLWTQDNAKLLQLLKLALKEQLIIQEPNSYLDYLIVLSFQKVNKLFVLSFENKNDIKAHTGYCYFDQTVKSNTRTYDNIWKIATHEEDDYPTCCLLDYNYFNKNDKVIAIDLSK